MLLTCCAGQVVERADDRAAAAIAPVGVARRASPPRGRRSDAWAACGRSRRSPGNPRARRCRRESSTGRRQTSDSACRRSRAGPISKSPAPRDRAAPRRTSRPRRRQSSGSPASGCKSIATPGPGAKRRLVPPGARRIGRESNAPGAPLGPPLAVAVEKAGHVEPLVRRTREGDLQADVQKRIRRRIRFGRLGALERDRDRMPDRQPAFDRGLGRCATGGYTNTDASMQVRSGHQDAAIDVASDDSLQALWPRGVPAAAISFEPLVELSHRPCPVRSRPPVGRRAATTTKFRLGIITVQFPRWPIDITVSAATSGQVSASGWCEPVPLNHQLNP